MANNKSQTVSANKNSMGQSVDGMDTGLLNDSISKKSTLAKEKQAMVQQEFSSSLHTMTPFGSDVFILSVLVCISFAVRFAYLSYPSEVVFDEVHFGKFASYYLRRTYYFDVHPPLGKMLYALVGWLVGYDGAFLFEKIGESYIENKVPYLAYRSLSVVFGALIPPLTYKILRDLNHSQYAALCAAICALFDNAMITHSRLIVLDSIFLSFTVLTVYSWVQFLAMDERRYSSNTENQGSYRKLWRWWLWLVLTGLFLACSMSVKFVGLFLVMLIGYETIRNLWHWLALDRKLSLSKWLGYEFLPRALALIVIPMGLFVFFFYIHLLVLNQNGPGDAFMSPNFITTLGRQGDNDPSTSPQRIPYFSYITLRHGVTNAYLHSHVSRYPLVYEDGRISSQGQQVTMYNYRDDNNLWQILPADKELELAYIQQQENGSNVRIPFVSHLDNIRLVHVLTQTELYTHNVAAALISSQMEMTTKNASNITNEANQWRIESASIKSSTTLKGPIVFKTLVNIIKIINKVEKVALCGRNSRLPEWGFLQMEVTGNRGHQDVSNEWIVQDVYFPETLRNHLNHTGYFQERSNEIKSHRGMRFHQKFWELLKAMQRQNALLKAEHPFASHPRAWFGLLNGIPYWTKHIQSPEDGLTRMSQIYNLGNPFAWWISSFSVVFFVFYHILEATFIQRGSTLKSLVISKETFLLCQRSGILFLVAWACHYLPFFLMERTRFLHHYLPASLFSTMMVAVFAEYVFAFIWNVSSTGIRNVKRRKAVMMAVFILFFLCVVLCFVYYSPLTYGRPALSYSQVVRRQWLKSWNINKVPEK